jgi:hypothetical protein
MIFPRIALADRNLCFVLMPFREDLDRVYDTIKEVVVLRHRMTCARADDIYSVGIIIEQVWAKICEAQIIIADATGRNPNVFYEMGLADAVGKRLVVLTQSMDDVPFDLRHRRTIRYNISELDALAIRLDKTIGELKWRPPQIKHWIDTDVKDLRIGLSSPAEGAVVNEALLEASGQVIGLQPGALRSYIQGFVTTDEEYQQGSAWIEKDGYWKIDQVHLGATTHELFFRIYDESGRQLARSRGITVIRRATI